MRTRRRNGNLQERRAQRARLGASDALQVNGEDEEQVPEGGASGTTTTPTHAPSSATTIAPVPAPTKLYGRRMQQTSVAANDANEPVPLRSRRGRGGSVARA